MHTLRSLCFALEEAGVGITLPSDATQESYRRDLARLFTATTAIKSKQTYYRYRAALCWFLKTHAVELSKLIRKADPSGGIAAPAELEALGTIVLDALAVIDPGTDQVQDSVAARRECPFEVQRSATSKRDGLKWLPRDWRFQMLEIVKDDNERWVALCILFGTGLRPSELEKGVTLTLRGNPLHLHIEIAGSKVTDDRGQEVRELCYLVDQCPDTPRLLERLALRNSGDTVRFAYPKQRLRALMRCIAGQLFRELPILPSPVSARHQFAADLKVANRSSDEIAQTMGHRSTRTQEKYGARRHGSRGGMIPARASALNPVRDKGVAHIVDGNTPIAGAVKAGSVQSRAGRGMGV